MTNDLPHGTGISSDIERGDPISKSSAQAPTPGHFPWRSISAGIVSVGTPVGISMLHPLLGEVLTVVELATMLIVLGTALFGTQTLSERAFRLLRWLGNRPEPPGPVTRG